MIDNDDIWVATVELRPGPHSAEFGEFAGAFVNVLVLAFDEEEAQEIIKEHMELYNFIIIDIADAERLDHRLLYGHISKELLSLRSMLGKGTKLVYGTFEAYSH